jgi:integrase
MKTSKITWRKVEPGIYRRQIAGTDVGSYYAVYNTGGRRVQESLKTDHLAEARRVLRVRRSKDGVLDPQARGLTLAAAAEKWLATRGDRGATTAKNDRLFVRRIREEWPGGAGMLVRNIRPSSAVAFITGIQSLPDRNGRRRQVSNSYRNHFAWTLRGIFDLCVGDGVIDSNPLAGFEGRGDRDVKRYVPTREQFAAIVGAIRGQRFSDTAAASADLLEFMGLAGVGGAECAALRWQDVDLRRGTIQLLRQKTGRAYTIRIYPRVRPLLERLREESAELGRDSVFEVKGCVKALIRACRDLKLPRFSPRSFRQMFITDALEAGIDPGIVARTQGHRDGGVLILRTYRHIRPQFEDEQLERLK